MDGKKKNTKPKEEKQENIPEEKMPDAAGAEEKVQLTQEEFEKVKAHIEALQKEKEELVSAAQRLQADFDNYRKRNSSLRTDSLDEGARDCMRALLPTLDNFDRALSNADGVDASFVSGMALVQKNLLETLQKLGLQEIDATGAFDANLHNAVMQEAVEGKASGEILEVLQKGYEAKGKILRYSMVRVAE